MDCIELAPGTFHLQNGSNMGLVIRDGEALLIDVGLDEDAGCRALRVVEQKGARLTALLATHAHADHFGGARYLQQRLDLPLYAPMLEAAIMENPIIEPLYLFSGAAPIAALRHKLTFAQSCRVSHRVEAGPLQIGVFHVEVVPLPGHALNQVGVACGGVLFCADAVFPQETLEKHKVLFCVDLQETLNTIKDLPDRPYNHFGPGHGPAYAAGEEIKRACGANRDRLEEIRDAVYSAVNQPTETSALVQQVSQHFRIEITTPTAYFLTQTTVLAAISSLERAGDVTCRTERNRLWWQRR